MRARLARTGRHQLTRPTSEGLCRAGLQGARAGISAGLALAAPQPVAAAAPQPVATATITSGPYMSDPDVKLPRCWPRHARAACQISDAVGATVPLMKRARTLGAGRPSKGDRVIMTTRLPKPLADAVRQRAEEDDLSFSEVVANAVAASFGQPPVAVPGPSDQMRLTA